MAGSLNKVLLIGRLGADPEVKQMVNGKSVARLSIATSNTWKDKNTGEKKEKTEWHRVVIFNEGLVSVVQQYVKKGAQVYIEGQLTTRKWKDEKSGVDRYSTEVVLQGFNSSFKILTSKTNQIENFQEAIGKECSFVELELMGDSNQSRIQYSDKGSIPMISINEAIDRIGGNAHLLKMDCEGSEWEILEEKQSLGSVRHITLEYHLWKNHQPHSFAIDAVKSHGFRILKHKPSTDFGIIVGTRD